MCAFKAKAAPLLALPISLLLFLERGSFSEALSHSSMINFNTTSSESLVGIVSFSPREWEFYISEVV